MKNKLERCPHCEGRAQTFHDKRLMNVLLWGVECVECGAMVWVLPDEGDESTAINLWNQRVGCDGDKAQKTMD